VDVEGAEVCLVERVFPVSVVVVVGLDIVWRTVTGGEIGGPIVEVGGGKIRPKTNGPNYILARST